PNHNGALSLLSWQSRGDRTHDRFRSRFAASLWKTVVALEHSFEGMGTSLPCYLSGSSMVSRSHDDAAKSYGAERARVDGIGADHVGGIWLGAEEGTPCVFHHHRARPRSCHVPTRKTEQ